MTKLQYLVGYLKNCTPNRWFGWLRQPKKSLNRACRSAAGGRVVRTRTAETAYHEQNSGHSLLLSATRRAGTERPTSPWSLTSGHRPL
jgi:hypothetical protein